MEPILIEMTSTKNTIVTDGICPTLTSRMGTGGNQVNAVLAIHEADGQDVTVQTEIAYSLVTGGVSRGKDTHA